MARRGTSDARSRHPILTVRARVSGFAEAEISELFRPRVIKHPLPFAWRPAFFTTGNNLNSATFACEAG